MNRLRGFTRTPFGRQLLVVLPCAAAPRLWFACTDQGVLWPDEIYQGLEQAHRLAFGYGFVPWEFQVGVRSWLYPGLLGLLFKVLSILGAHAPELAITAKIIAATWALVGIAFAMRLAWRLAGPAGSLLAGALLASFPLSLAYDARCTSESASGPLILIAAYGAVFSERERAKTRWVAGAAAGLAVVLRPQNVVAVAALLLGLAVRKRWNEARSFGLGCTAALGLSGILDVCTWGAPFKPLVGYLQFNLVEGGSARYGVEPLGFYFSGLWSSTGPAILLVATGLLLIAPRAEWLVVLASSYFLAHCLVGHKEMRFLLPVIPLTLALSGAGLSRGTAWLLRRLSRKTPTDAAFPAGAAMLGVVLSIAMAFRAAGLTEGDLGRRTADATARSVWHDREAWNRALWRASTEPELCGLVITGEKIIWTGGYTYLHRDVPVLNEPFADALQAVNPSANYVLAPSSVPHGSWLTLVATIEDLSLYRRSGDCLPPPESFTRLFAKPH